MKLKIKPNWWRKWPKRNPKRDGLYLCTCVGSGERTIEILYWQKSVENHLGGVWMNRDRIRVFEGYKCYKSGREPIEANRVFEDRLCERIDIIAWKELPKVFRGIYK